MSCNKVKGSCNRIALLICVCVCVCVVYIRIHDVIKFLENVGATHNLRRQKGGMKHVPCLRTYKYYAPPSNTYLASLAT
jgi:hypothetical protein